VEGETKQKGGRGDRKNNKEVGWCPSQEMTKGLLAIQMFVSEFQIIYVASM
jgi:hypothetical protein